MHFDKLIQQSIQHQQDRENTPNLVIPKDWGQGRTCFGGVSAALLYNSIKCHIGNDRVMRSLNCNFIGPLLTDVPFTIEIEILRHGKNVSQVVARAIQNEQLAVMCQVSFGVSRQSKVNVENQDMHTMSVPKKANFIPQIPKIVPKFLRHFELSFHEGRAPFTGSTKSHIHGWMRFKEAPEQITDAHLICLIDAWPPTILQMLKWPAPASTMCWNVEFIHPHKAFSPKDWFAYQAHTRQAADGYGHTEANIWDQNGELVAISRQAVAVFD